MKVLIEAHVFCAQAGLARVSGRSISSLLGWGSSPVRHTIPSASVHVGAVFKGDDGRLLVISLVERIVHVGHGVGASHCCARVLFAFSVCPEMQALANANARSRGAEFRALAQAV